MRLLEPLAFWSCITDNGDLACLIAEAAARRHERKSFAQYGWTMTPLVRVERVEGSPLAALRRASSRGSLGRDIIAGFDILWPVLRAQGVATGRNVVVYHGGVEDIEVGVEVDSRFEEAGDVKRSRTPAGDAAAVTHWGDYSAMQPAYAALETWFQSSGRRSAGVSWEIYGHWADDPSQRRTDIYRLLAPT
jgi:effector-binding domain-containing protein